MERTHYISATDRKIIQRHYGMTRTLTQKEVEAEFEMLRRRAEAGMLYDSQERLAAQLGLI